MSPRLVDEEKGEAGLYASDPVGKEINVSCTSTPTTPCSPDSSQGSTLIGRTSTLDSGTTGFSHQNSLWSRRVQSFRLVLGLRKQICTDLPVVDEATDGVDGEVQDRNASIVRKIHESPRGYPKLAAFLDSDENFMLFRRFGFIQTRLLLEKQDELAILERELDRMERLESKDVEKSTQLRSRQFTHPDKKAILRQMETTWNQYCHLISNAASMNALNKPTAGEKRSVDTWMQTVRPVYGLEAEFLRRKEDLITLRPGREHAMLDSAVERLLQCLNWLPVRRLFQSRDTREKSDEEDGIRLYTRSRIQGFVMVIVTIAILALLVIPVWLMSYLSEKMAKKMSDDMLRQNSYARKNLQFIGVLLVSTLAFSACISLFTGARRHEILGASAAYCAVLVVFIGNLGQ